MAKAPPVPTENQSPFPLVEPPHAQTADADTPAIGDEVDQAVASARETVGPLAERARRFARERPWATAALVGTIGLAVLNTLRGRRT